jgi:Lon protease-like protein
VAAPKKTTSTTRLRGISEWRDRAYRYPGTGDDRRLGREQGAPPREVCVLPFPYEDVLLQGETKQLRLYEDRFVKLFEACLKDHGGVLAMGLLAGGGSGIVQTAPLCEIEDYNAMLGGGFGVFVTIRAVSRARILEITQEEPFIRAVCAEVADKIPPNLELPNLVAANIEDLILLLSSMEHRLAQAGRGDGEGGADDDANKPQSSPLDEEEREMQRRIAIARLVRSTGQKRLAVASSPALTQPSFLFLRQEDRFYADEDEEEDDEEADEPRPFDRRDRFRKAYQVALSTDAQGYHAVKPGGDATVDRSPRELAAVSWAAFCTEILPDADAQHRILALDYENLFDRLKLALSVLRQKKEKLKERMDRAGIKFRADESLGGGDDGPPASSSK